MHGGLRLRINRRERSGKPNDNGAERSGKNPFSKFHAFVPDKLHAGAPKNRARSHHEARKPKPNNERMREKAPKRAKGLFMVNVWESALVKVA